MSRLLLRNFLFHILFTLLLIINIILLFLPLTEYVSYEYFAINGLFITIFAGIFFLEKKNLTSNTIRIFAETRLILLLIIPLGIALIKAISAGICSIEEAIYYYLVFTVPAPIIGIGLASTALILFERKKYLLYSIILIILILFPIIDIYFLPQVYFYNPLVTYFPGTIYDESIPITFRIVLYKIILVALSITIFFLQVKFTGNRFERRTKNAIKVLILLLPVLSYLIFPTLGFITTNRELETQLSQKNESDNIIFYCDQSITKSELVYIKNLSEIFYSELEEYFKRGVEGKIKCYIFKNREQKGDLLGTKNADVAKPWLKQIFITQGSYESTLKHELAHIFAGEFANNLLRVDPRLNFALIEGIATAADNEYDIASITDITHSALKSDYYINPKKLFSNEAFFVNASSSSYIFSGAYIEYLVDKYGISSVMRWYNGEKYEKIFPKELQKDDRDFGEYLKKKSETELSNHTLKYLFGRSSIFTKDCPRYVANKINEANSYIENNSYHNALNVFEEISHKTNSPSVLMGRVSMLNELGYIDSARSLLTSQIGEYYSSGSYFNLLMKLGDLHYLQSDTLKDVSIYDSILNFDISIPYTFSAKLRLELVSRKSLKSFLESKGDSKINLILKEAEIKLSPPILYAVLLSTEMNSERRRKILDDAYRLIIDGAKSFDSSTIREKDYLLIKLCRYYFLNGDIEKGRNLTRLISDSSSNNRITKKRFNLISNLP